MRCAPGYRHNDIAGFIIGKPNNPPLKSSSSASKHSSSTWIQAIDNSWKLLFLVVVVQSALSELFLLFSQCRSHILHCWLSTPRIPVTMIAWQENCLESHQDVLRSTSFVSNHRWFFSTKGKPVVLTSYVVAISPSADPHNRYNIWHTKYVFCLEMKCLIVCVSLRGSYEQKPLALTRNARCFSDTSSNSGML